MALSVDYDPNGNSMDCEDKSHGQPAGTQPGADFTWEITPSSGAGVSNGVFVATAPSTYSVKPIGKENEDVRNATPVKISVTQAGAESELFNSGNVTPRAHSSLFPSHAAATKLHDEMNANGQHEATCHGINTTLSALNYGIFYPMTAVTPQLVRRADAVFRHSGGVMRSSSAIAAGIHPRTLYYMRDQGLLEQLSRGVFHLAALPLPVNPDVVAVVQRVPHGVISLVSALDPHGLTTQIPQTVDVAIERGVTRPRIDYPPIRVFRMSPESFREGVEEISLGTTSVPVFGVAKTVADCFKYRTRVGHDVAVEALREALRTQRATPAEIMQAAATDRVAAVIRPYLEALQ